MSGVDVWLALGKFDWKIGKESRSAGGGWFPVLSQSTLPLSIQVYNWVPVNPCTGLAIHQGGKGGWVGAVVILLVLHATEIKIR